MTDAEHSVDRRPDPEARAVYAEDPNPATLAAARVGLEHVEHHERPLRFLGSSYVGGHVEHRFACHVRVCPFRLAWVVDE